MGDRRVESFGAWVLHHSTRIFSASDIPKQARALYLRNLIRVIPAASYRPVPPSPGGLGTRLMGALILQLAGDVQRTADALGTSVTLTLPRATSSA